MIVSSSFVLGHEQGDGRRYVIETHTAADGQTFKHEYLSDGADPAAVMSARAEVLNAQLAEKEAVQAAINGTALPLTVYEFLKRIPAAKRIAIRARAKTDPIVEDFMDLLNRSGAVYPTNEDVQAGLGYLVSQNLLTAEEAAVIGAA
jgi:xanthine dehydrogenase iron-sulfur cluster and FAD-binding subunit A